MVATRPRSTTTRIGGLEIRWAAGLLEPRPWTAAQAAWADELLGTAPAGPVLELCTGAGHIGLLAVRDRPDRRLVAVDRDPLACEFARLNAEDAGMADRVEVRCTDVGSAPAPEELFSLVVADPPWVPRQHTSRFPQDPVAAIDGGADGLDVARRCVAVAERHLLPGGCCLLQLGDEGQLRVLQRWLACPSGVAMAVVETRSHAPGGIVARLVRSAGEASC